LEDGGVLLSSGETLEKIDCIILCTGYKFNFDFLRIDEKDLASKQNKVSPLYHHLFYARDPSLSFIGLPWKVIPFILMQMQARWVSQVLSSNHPDVTLPSTEEMLEHVREVDEIKKEEDPKYYHMFGDYQFEYNNMIS
jgi:hypothetical protein